MSGSRSHLDREIREQPIALARLLHEGAAATAAVASVLRERPSRYVQIAARGSSDNAARYAQYLFGERLGLPVALAAPSLESLYSARAVPHGDEGLVLGISQSGRSPDIVAVLAAARAAGAPTLAITNDPRSPLAEAAELVISLAVGEEESVAATKTYTASLAALAALCVELGRGSDEDRAALAAIPQQVEETVEDAYESVAGFDAHARAEHVVTVGRGYNYATAMEIALKVRELSATVAEGFSAADLMHGPIAAIAPGTPAVAVAPRGRALPSVSEAVQALKHRGAEVILIGEGPEADLSLPAGVPEWLSPIVAVVPGQVLALRRAVVGEHSVDAPAGLTKVTETY